MGEVQTSYAFNMSKGYEGQVSDLSDSLIESYAVEATAIKFGYAVQAGTSDNQVKKALATFLGMAVRTHENANADAQYEIGEASNIMKNGKMYASVEGTGSKGDALTFLTASGQLSTASADGTHIATTVKLNETQATTNAIVEVVL